MTTAEILGTPVWRSSYSGRWIIWPRDDRDVPYRALTETEANAIMEVVRCARDLRVEHDDPPATAADRDACWGMAWDALISALDAANVPPGSAS